MRTTVEASDVKRLAKVVAEPGTDAGLIDPDNHRCGRKPIARAARAGDSFYVQVRQQILALDGDKPEVAATADDALLLLRLAGLHGVHVASGQPGRCHVFAYIEDQGVRQILTAWAKSVGWDVRQTIRPPLAAHRMDYTPRLLQPTSVEEAARWLSPRGATTGRGVSRKMLDQIVHGNSLADRSSLLSSIALSLVNAGFTFEDFRDLVETTGTAASAAYYGRMSDRGQATTERWLETYAWAWAEQKHQESPPASGPQELQELRDWALQRQWPGRTGGTDRDVYLALIERASKPGLLTFTASLRELTELARLGSRNTTKKALERLQDQGLIRPATVRERKATGLPVFPNYGDTSAWTLPTEVLDDPSLQTPPNTGLDGSTTRHDDLYRYGKGLGKGTEQTHMTLIYLGTATPAEISAKTGYRGETTRNHLRKLREYGLAAKENGSWHPKYRSYDEVAAEIGVLGRGEQQRLQHEHERHHYRQVQASHEEASQQLEARAKARIGSPNRRRRARR